MSSYCCQYNLDVISDVYARVCLLALDLERCTSEYCKCERFIQICRFARFTAFLLYNVYMYEHTFKLSQEVSIEHEARAICKYPDMDSCFP